MSFVLILGGCLLFTLLMTYFNKSIPLMAGAIASAIWMVYIMIKCGVSPLEARSILLFILSTILLIVSAVAVMKKNRRKNIQ